MSVRGVGFLALRYLRFHWVKTVILLACVTSTLCLPLTVQRLVERFEESLLARARVTPLVVGARGSRVDLTLHALYFRAEPPGDVSVEVAQRIRDTGYALPIPLHARHTAGGFPVVGTTLEYFGFRGLSLADGRMLTRLGDCVLGAGAARELRLQPGARLMTDPENIFDIAGAHPVNLRVVGILAPAGTADDGAVFVDLKTTWLAQGLIHGHQDVARTTNEDVILSRSESNVVANAALPQHLEVTEANLASFHAHGDPRTFPVTAILAVPKDLKSDTLLRGRFRGEHSLEQILVPVSVVEELMGLVFRVKRFFDANTVVISVSTLLFLTLVVLLSVRLRRREMEVMFRLGCSRGMMVRLQAAELALIGTASLLLSLAGATLALRLAPLWLGIP
jgi:putative ABC transport system permease protein